MVIFMWYPGHIEKAKNQIRKNLKGVDAIIEILDSRIPYTSRAYEYEKIFGDKQKIIILNKIDLSDEKLTSEWVKYFKKNDKIIKANLKKSDAKSFLIKKVSPLIKSKFIEKRIMVVGMPNVGKSTFINRLKGKKSLSVGNRPGVTRGVQWLSLNKELMILDTPGILYKNVYNKNILAKLLAVGSIPVDKTDLMESFKLVIDLLINRYSFDRIKHIFGEENIFDNDYEKLAENYCYIKRFLGKGGTYDVSRGVINFFKELNEGNFGRFTYESISDIQDIILNKKDYDIK